MIVEMAGLPGSGKTTICRAVSVPYADKRSVPLWRLAPRWGVLRAAVWIAALALSARPVTMDRFRRARKFIFFLRMYQGHEPVVLLDQGIVQKIWSLLAGAEKCQWWYADRLMEALVPFRPDWLVWVNVPTDVAVARISGRSHGTSRYDGLPAGEARALLDERGGLFRQVFDCYAERAGVPVLEVDGERPVEENARKIEALLKGAGGRT